MPGGRVVARWHTAPIGFVVALFAASRIWAWEAGVRFDASPLAGFWQILDPTLLRHHLAQSVWYLHAQPPLYNLFLGIGLKVFGSAFGTAAHGTQIAVGLSIALSLYVLLLAVGATRWPAAALASLFAVSPAMIVYENWLFYEYLAAALLLITVVAFVMFERRPTVARSFAVFGALGTVCYIRASFQILLLVLVLALMLAVFRGQRRSVVAGAVVPILLVAGLSVRNWVEFGTPSTSSWAGMNLMQIDQAGFRGNEEQTLQERGVIGPISAIPVFQPLDAYRDVVPLQNTGAFIPVLDDPTKPTSGVPNFNNITYVDISNRYMHDFVQVLLHEPSIYFRGVWTGVRRAVTPATDYYFFLPNRTKIEPWVRGYDAAVLWQPHVSWANGRPVGTAWGIVVGYVAALLFGAWETVRLLRRRRGSAAIALTWLLLLYATTAMTFGEVAENQRLRFVGDPLATILVGALAVRGLAWARRRLGWARLDSNQGPRDYESPALTS